MPSKFVFNRIFYELSSVAQAQIDTDAGAGTANNFSTSAGKLGNASSESWSSISNAHGISDAGWEGKESVNPDLSVNFDFDLNYKIGAIRSGNAGGSGKAKAYVLIKYLTDAPEGKIKLRFNLMAYSQSDDPDQTATHQPDYIQVNTFKSDDHTSLSNAQLSLTSGTIQEIELDDQNTDIEIYFPEYNRAQRGGVDKPETCCSQITFSLLVNALPV